MFQWLLLLSLSLLSLSVMVSIYRLIRGPSMADRVLALDAISYHIIGIVTV